MVVEKTKTKLFTNEWHSHLPQGSHYPLKWTEPVKIQSCLVYRQKSITVVDIVGVTQRVCEQVSPSNEGRRLDALDGWIGNRWECLASILSLLVAL